MHDKPSLLTIAQAAERLGVSPSFLNKRRHDGTGPTYFKVAGKIGYAPEDLAAWLVAQRRRSTADTSAAAPEVSR